MLSNTIDRTGFPLVHIDPLNLDVHLFPVTKVQFEAFLTESNEFDDQWYKQVLKLNQRGCAQTCWVSEPESAFLTGILPEEAQAFARWLGDAYRLPTIDEWQAVCLVFARRNRTEIVLQESQFVEDDVTATWLRGLLKSVAANSLVEVSRMQSGVLEWVKSRRGWQLLGEPREDFSKQLFSCSQPVIPVDRSRRNRLFGFRLVRWHESRRIRERE